MSICIDSCVSTRGLQVRYLLSDHRHFLRDLRTDAYDVLDAAEFVTRWEADTL